MTIHDLYDRQIKRRSYRERLRIAQWILKDLAREEIPSEPETKGPRRSLLELEGLGAEIWEGVDAQDYVDELRSEWEQVARPF